MVARLALISAVVAVSSGVLAGSAGAQAIRDCGNAGTLYGGEVSITNVTSRIVGCSSARAFARRRVFRGGPACDEDRSCNFRGWRCRNVARGGKIDVRCTRGARVVRFQYG